MRFLIDECTGPSVAKWLQDEGHEIYSIYDKLQGNFTIVTEETVRIIES